MDTFTYDIVQLESNVTVSTVTIKAENLDDADVEVKKNLPKDCTFFLNGFTTARTISVTTLLFEQSV